MNISLSEFESEIDSQIVSRGQDYFSSGAVSGLKQITDDTWAAYVDGTERYKARIVLKGDEVADYSCSCPYDLGPVCKHIVAALYELKERIYSHDKELGKAMKPSKAGQEACPQESLEEALSCMPRKSLEAVILEYAGREPEIADYIFAKKAINVSTSDKEQYRKIIKDSINTAKDRHGFIGYWQVSKAVRGAEIVLDKAEEFISRSNAKKAFPIYQSIMEEMVPLVQNADDSNGEIGSVIEDAFEGLSICARLAKGELRKKLLDYFFDEFEHKRYEGWSDWKWNFLEMAAQMTADLNEQERLFKKLDQSIETVGKSKDDWSARYDIETVLMIKLTVLERLGTDKEVEDFIQTHIRYPVIRQRAIEKAFERKDFAIVKKLSQEGERLSKEQNLPGIVNTWCEWALRASEAEHNMPEVKKYTLSLFLDTGDFDYYKRYKKCFSDTEWKEEVERVIKLSGEPKGYCQDRTAQIFIQEQRWSDLLAYAQKNLSSYILEFHGKYLIPKFPQEMAIMYEKVITEELAPEAGRSNYKRVCQFLRRMKKVDMHGRVKTLVEELSSKYKNRPAFLEEMRRI